MKPITMLPPSNLLFASEPLRLLFEAGSLPLANLTLSLPQGDGHPVMVIPGFMTGDITTVMLRRQLHNLGYRVHRWRQGVNLGPHIKPDSDSRILQRLEKLHAYKGQKVSLIGWSLGGLYARELAKERPDLVRQVITLGSPIFKKPKDLQGVKIWELYSQMSGTHATSPDILSFVDRVSQPVEGVPTTAIYSRVDGFVPPETAQVFKSKQRQNIEVIASHIGLVANPFVNFVVADRLSQSEQDWQPFHFKGWRKWMFR